MGLALLSSLLTFTNYLVLHWTTVVCCACVSSSKCMGANLTPLQLFANVLCLLFIYSAFLWYYPLEPFSIYRQQRKREYLRAQVLLGLVLIIAIIFSATSVTLYYGLNLSTKTLATWGRAIGILSAIVVIVQWMPQIFTTFQLGSAGSLSVVMLLIQLPGCLLTVFFQAVIGGADFTTWGPYLITSINLTILIIMCLVFWIRNRNRIIQENFDILLSEDEHIVYEYDQDNDTMARKTYGSFTKGPAPVHLATPSNISEAPTSGKMAWSLSDRTGFKGKSSAATFITSGTTQRTRAHLSGKDLLGSSIGRLELDEDDLGLDEEGFERWENGSGDGTAQPPPDHRNRASHSQRYLGTSLGVGSLGNGHSLSSSFVSSSSPRSPRSNQAHLSSKDQPRGGVSVPSSYAPSSTASSFSNSMGVLESVEGSFLPAPPNTPYSSSRQLTAGMDPELLRGGIRVDTIEEVVESDADDVNFTEDPLRQNVHSLDTPNSTLDGPSFQKAANVTLSPTHSMAYSPPSAPLHITLTPATLPRTSNASSSEASDSPSLSSPTGSTPTTLEKPAIQDDTAATHSASTDLQTETSSAKDLNKMALHSANASIERPEGNEMAASSIPSVEEKSPLLSPTSSTDSVSEAMVVLEHKNTE